ncbi:hypothetical protein SARC_10689, partial [Sphaeroforma arctica JP610]
MATKSSCVVDESYQLCHMPDAVLGTSPMEDNDNNALVTVQSTAIHIYHLVLCILFVLSTLPGTDGFYVPGLAPQEWKEGDTIPLKAVKMTSVKTQLPYPYYSLPFCDPETKK